MTAMVPTANNTLTVRSANFVRRKATPFALADTIQPRVHWMVIKTHRAAMNSENAQHIRPRFPLTALREMMLNGVRLRARAGQSLGDESNLKIAAYVRPAPTRQTPARFVKSWEYFWSVVYRYHEQDVAIGERRRELTDAQSPSICARNNQQRRRWKRTSDSHCIDPHTIAMIWLALKQVHIYSLQPHSMQTYKSVIRMLCVSRLTAASNNNALC